MNRYPDLDFYLKASRMGEEPVQYLKKAVLSSVTLSAILFFFLGFVEYFVFGSVGFALILSVLVFVFVSFYNINIPRYNLIKAKGMIESELISAIRFLSLELRSQRSLHGAIKHTAENFPVIGLYFEEILNDVKLGKTMEDSLEKAIDLCPSPHLRNLFWQLTNSLQTGADISDSLENLLGDIEEEQQIRVEEYGKELNALSLFYMMISIIIPTVGLTIVTAVLTFVGINIPLGALLMIWFTIAFIQFMFVQYSLNKRPRVEGY